ncbi:hypothetical protein CSIM01_08227 [Colletotrichum simmondsii]|uniref:Uncharacterized protein n=1 Tax=Colletotrichum simmondsii TaxID=703756 RepID=A0A135TTM9_9PEZI|nr:hypothetical protein CSIM01_08227 [Colletotrichum simmondsii]
MGFTVPSNGTLPASSLERAQTPIPFYSSLLTAEPPLPIFEAEGKEIPALWEQLDLLLSFLRRVTLRQGSKKQKSQTLRLALPTMIPTPARRRLTSRPIRCLPADRW